MRSFLALIIIFNLFGCASVKRVFYPYEDPTPQGAVAAPKLYQAGVAALQRQEYAIALADFDRFRSEESPTRYSQVSVYNSGVALEGLQNWEEARRRYRQVIGATDMKTHRASKSWRFIDSRFAMKRLATMRAPLRH